MVLGLKIGWDHFHYMMHQGLTSRSLLKLDMLVFQFLWLWVGNKNGTCCMLHIFLNIHEQHDLVFHNTNKNCLHVNVVYLVL
jgi:hypothetical protein